MVFFLEGGSDLLLTQVWPSEKVIKVALPNVQRFVSVNLTEHSGSKSQREFELFTHLILFTPLNLTCQL